MFTEPRRELEAFCRSRGMIYIPLRTDDDMAPTVRRGVLTAERK